MQIIECFSPNYDSRDDHAVDMLVLHYTGMTTGAEALARLCDSTANVSAHYMVEEDGTVYRLVNEECRAWHAGVSTWRGHTNINQRSMGIEIVNPGHEFGYRPFPQAQMEAVATLCAEVIARHPIPARNVVAHSDIAPQRKEDPGEKFDWQWLAKQGVGLWPDERRNTLLSWADSVDETLPDTHPAVCPLPPYAEIQSDLATYGYDCPRTGELDDATHKVILAFQRHFHPQWLTGQWNRQCAVKLASLLTMV